MWDKVSQHVHKLVVTHHTCLVELARCWHLGMTPTTVQTGQAGHATTDQLQHHTV